ncbi:hypothetical protein D3C73_790830 [compost metagenome]
MNDCWPVASWAGMDYYGRWKALQYTVRKSYQDLLLSIDGSDGENLRIHAVSDRQEGLEGELRVRLQDFSGAVLQEWSQPVALAADSASIVFAADIAGLLEGREPRRVLLTAALLADGQQLDLKHHYFVSAKEIPLARPAVKVEAVQGSTAFTVSTDVLARGVYLTADEEGIFSDNFFDLLPGESKTVEFFLSGSGEQDFTPAAPKGLGIYTMADYIDESLL